MNKIAICGDSWASDFNNSGMVETQNFNNKHLWCYHVGKLFDVEETKIFGIPESSNYRIHLQVERAIKENFNIIIVCLTTPFRIDTHWFDRTPNVFDYKRSESMNASNERLKDYVMKYYNIDYQISLNNMIINSIFSLLKESGCKYYIFKNIFDHIYGGYKHHHRIFHFKDYINKGPVDFEMDTKHRYTSPNHLSIEENQNFLNYFKTII